MDVGGGRGQALLAIQDDCKKAFSERLVLQDTTAVIDTLQSDTIPGIKPMVYDIFTPQPINDKYLKSALALWDIINAPA